MSMSSQLQTDVNVKEKQHQCKPSKLESDGRFCDAPGGVEGITRGGSKSSKAIEERPDSLSSSRLFAQLKATKIKESVMMGAIDRFGGGEEGLRGALKAIMVWVVERNRYLAQTGDPLEIDVAPCENVPATAMQSVEETSQESFWDNAEAINSQLGSFLSCDPILSEPDEGSCLTRTLSGYSDSWVSLSDMKIDGASGDYSEVAMLDFQDGNLMGEMEQESRLASSDIAASPSCCTTETTRRSLVRKLPLSTLSSGCDRSTHDGTRSSQPSAHKIQRRPLPPVVNSSSPSVCEEQNIFGSVEANLFVPFASALPSNMEPLSVDVSSLTSFDMRSPMSAEDLSSTNPVLGVRLCSSGSMDMHQVPIQNCAPPEIDWAPLGEAIKPEAPTAASIRLARKKRIHKNRKAASQATLSSTSSVERPAPSLELPGQTTCDQRKGGKDRTGATYLLEKQLRASDVGSLSRIILPKKDAEIHLPALSQGDGIPFDCEDYITGENMELRFRFWPNNKSRMYLLENTGEFIRRHQLRAADSIAMYRDEEGGAYLLRPSKAGEGQEPRRFGRKGKEIIQASSSGSLARSTTSSLVRSVSESSVSCNIDSFDTLKAALEPVVIASVSPVLPAQDASLSRVESIDLPGAHVKNGTDSSLNSVESVNLPDVVARDNTHTLFRFPSLEAFDAEMFS